MRSRTDYIMTKEEVYGYSENWLSTALLLGYEGRKCTTSVLFRILLIAAGRVVSLFAACRDLADAPCSRTVYNALLATLPDMRELQRRLNRSLCHKLPKALLRRSRRGIVKCCVLEEFFKRRIPAGFRLGRNVLPRRV